MSIPLDQLGAASDDGKRRDRWGRLLVVPPEGGEPVGYTRVTTVAKTTDDGGGLMPWKATMAVVGTMQRPGLRAKWEALISAHDGDPWYASDEAKAASKRLVEEAAEAGGATNRRDQGIALHAITARLDEGAEVRHLTPETERDVEVYRATLADAGVRILPEFVETTVVLDDWQVGGTFDRLVEIRGFDLPLIADLKTGEDLSYSWHSFAVQEAGYAHGDDLYEQGLALDGSEDERITMPEVDQRHGLVIHLPAGGGRCSLHIVDLEAGWHGFQLSMAVRDFRRQRGLVQALAERDGLAEALERSLPPVPDLVPQIRAWLQGRIDTIGRHEAARLDLMRSWPPAIPPLKLHDAHDDLQLAAIEGLLDAVEARHGLPFGPTKPGQPMRPSEPSWIDRLARAFPGSTIERTTDQ